MAGVFVGCGGNDECTTDADCPEGENCTFDSEINGTNYRDYGLG